jgi:hypothetical protein
VKKTGEGLRKSGNSVVTSYLPLRDCSNYFDCWVVICGVGRVVEHYSFPTRRLLRLRGSHQASITHDRPTRGAGQTLQSDDAGLTYTFLAGKAY